jgi:hypothetical protein
MSNYPSPQSYPTPGYPQEGYRPEQPRSGCGGCLGKFLILLGVIFLLIIGLCCGGFFYFKSYITSSTSKDPVEVQKISGEIIAINAAPLEPVGGGRFKLPLAGTSLGQGVFYSDKNHKSVLILASIGDAFGPQFKDQLLKGLESGQSQNQPGVKNENHEELKDVKKSRLERKIQGEKAIFDIVEGVGEKTNIRRIRVQGEFKGMTGPAVFILDAEAEALPREKVEKIIDSMK